MKSDSVPIELRYAWAIPIVGALALGAMMVTITPPPPPPGKTVH